MRRIVAQRARADRAAGEQVEGSAEASVRLRPVWNGVRRFATVDRRSARALWPCRPAAQRVGPRPAATRAISNRCGVESRGRLAPRRRRSRHGLVRRIASGPDARQPAPERGGRGCCRHEEVRWPAAAARLNSNGRSVSACIDRRQRANRWPRRLPGWCAARSRKRSPGARASTTAQSVNSRFGRLIAAWMASLHPRSGAISRFSETPVTGLAQLARGSITKGRALVVTPAEPPACSLGGWRHVRAWARGAWCCSRSARTPAVRPHPAPRNQVSSARHSHSPVARAVATTRRRGSVANSATRVA